MHNTIDHEAKPPIVAERVRMPDPLRAGRFNALGEEDPEGNLFVGMGSGICHTWAAFSEPLAPGQRGEMTFTNMPGSYVNTGNFTEWVPGPPGYSFHAIERKTIGMPPGSKYEPKPDEIGPDTTPMQIEEGIWDLEVHVFEKGPDEDPTIVHGVEDNHLMTNMNGDPWIITRYNALFRGMNFEQHGQWGYDPNTEKYHASWLKTVQANLGVFEGDYDKRRRVLTIIGESRNCFGEKGPDGKVLVVREKRVTTYVNSHEKTYEVYQQEKKGRPWAKRDFIIGRKRRPATDVNVPRVGDGRFSLIALQRGLHEARVIGRNTHHAGLPAAAGVVMLGPAWNALYKSTLRL